MKYDPDNAKYKLLRRNKRGRREEDELWVRGLKEVAQMAMTKREVLWDHFARGGFQYEAKHFTIELIGWDVIM